MSAKGAVLAVESMDSLAMITHCLLVVRGNRNLRESTVSAYADDLRLLDERLQRRGKTLLSATAEDLERDTEECRTSGTKERTLARRHASARTFYRYLMERNLISQDPMLSVTRLKLAKRNLELKLTEEELERLMSLPCLGNKHVAVRNQAILRLACTLKIPLSFLRKLRLDQVDLLQRRVRVANGSTVRYVEIEARSAELLEEFISGHQPEISKFGPSPYLFPSYHGDCLTRQAFWHVIRQLLKRSLLFGRGIRTIDLRRAYSSYALKAQKDPCAKRDQLRGYDLAQRALRPWRFRL